MQNSICAQLFVIFIVAAIPEGVKANITFRSAVYEHLLSPAPKSCQVLPCNRTSALTHVFQVLEIYEVQMATAKEKGAEIIVFPEDGLFGLVWTRVTLQPFLEYIPDPQTETWNPCLDPSKYANAETQIRASCLARKYGMFMAMNMGDKQACSSSQLDCPSGGFYFYNTDIMFDNQGQLIARYHKQNLFEGEKRYWNQPSVPEIISVDTPLGRFGFITCFDILFEVPAIELTKLVDTILLPTAWKNVLPLFPAISFHSAWAQGNGVNLLAANLRQPKQNRTGSGIYSAKGPINFYHDDDVSHQSGKLLIADLPIHRPFYEQINWNASASMSNLTANPSFGSELFYDSFQWAVLEANEGNAKVCHGNFCCIAEYQKGNFHDEENFALGAFSGLHTAQGQYFLQVCIVQACGANTDQCGSGKTHSNATFEYLTLAGSFETQYVFPQVILDGIALAPKQYFVATDGRLILDRPTTSGLLTASLFGRCYERD